MPKKILLVDDEKVLVKLVKSHLEDNGYEVIIANDGKTGLEKYKTENPDLILLDIMMPKMSGFEVCRRLRAVDNQVAILMLTARDEDIDKIIGLELGADDYLTKPFNPRELVARVKAILRRVERTSLALAPTHIGDLVIDATRREVHIGERSLGLRTQEFELLLILAGQPGRVFTREQLLQQAWGFDFYGQTRTVDVHIAHLRKKLTGSSVKIETVTGIGYKLAE